MDIYDEYLFDTKELASYLKVSPRTVQGWRLRKEGPEYVRLPAGVRYTGRAVRKYLDELTVR